MSGPILLTSAAEVTFAYNGKFVYAFFHKFGDDWGILRVQCTMYNVQYPLTVILLC